MKSTTQWTAFCISRYTCYERAEIVKYNPRIYYVHGRLCYNCIQQRHVTTATVYWSTLPPTNADDVENVVAVTTEQWKNYALCTADIHWFDATCECASQRTTSQAKNDVALSEASITTRLRWMAPDTTHDVQKGSSANSKSFITSDVLKVQHVTESISCQNIKWKQHDEQRHNCGIYHQTVREQSKIDQSK